MAGQPYGVAGLGREDTRCRRRRGCSSPRCTNSPHLGKDRLRCCSRGSTARSSMDKGGLCTVPRVGWRASRTLRIPRDIEGGGWGEGKVEV